MPHVYVTNFCDNQTENDDWERSTLDEMASPQFVRVYADFCDKELDEVQTLATDHLLDVHGDEIDFDQQGHIHWSGSNKLFDWEDDGWQEIAGGKDRVVAYRNLRLMAGDKVMLLVVIQKTELH